MIFATLTRVPRRGSGAQVVVLLLRAGASAALLDEDGQTALHHAAGEGHLEALKVLALDAECAELFVTDKYEMTPFHLACENGHSACVAHLLALIDQLKDEPGAAKKVEQMRRGSALFLAQKNEHHDVVSVIEGSSPLSTHARLQPRAGGAGSASGGGGGSSG